MPTGAVATTRVAAPREVPQPAFVPVALPAPEAAPDICIELHDGPVSITVT